jgi:hypothetical protein
MMINKVIKERKLDNKIKKMITKQSQLTKKKYINNIHKNELIIYIVINMILFSTLFYLMIKNK